MLKTWLIARHHFRQEATKFSFLLVLFSLPLFLLFALGLAFTMERVRNQTVSIGYVDPEHLLNAIAAPESYDVRLVAFPDRDAALAALDGDQISAFYVLQSGPGGRLDAEFVFYEPPPWRPQREFVDAVRVQLLAAQPDEVATRVLSGPRLTVRSVDIQREFPGGDPSAGSVIPAILAVMFAFLVLTTAGYMMEVVVVEKESRTIEVVLTSVSPRQMMVGKIIGALGIAALQLALWLVCLVGVIWLGREVFEIAWLQQVAVRWSDVVLLTLVAVPAYVVLAGLTTAIGATLSESQEAQQLGPLLFVLLISPLYLIFPLATNPDGGLSLALTLFPPTAVVTLGVRSMFAAVPAWQFLLSAAVATVTAAAALWLAAKALRTSMLRYGQRVRLLELVGLKRAETATPRSGVAGGGVGHA